MDRNNNERMNYTHVGFNGFLRRSIASNRNAQTLHQVSSGANYNTINFDTTQVSGGLGDTIEVGNILVDGTVPGGRIDGRDEGDTVWRLGALD